MVRHNKTQRGGGTRPLTESRAIFYQVSVGTVGFAMGAEVSSPPLRPATIAVVGLTQTVLYALRPPFLLNLPRSR